MEKISVATPGSEQAFAPTVRVWLVDDNEEIRRLIAELLSHQDGIECVRHFSSPDALLSALASQPGPDVILLDVQMGDRNGLDAVRPIKSLTRATRVLMFTTCYNKAWRERALDEGASDYLLKSDTVEKVASRIRCPADDPGKNFYPRRRRANCAAALPMSDEPSSIPEKTPRFFSRTLKMLGLYN
jgi:DNA-binding NarL/FixJ family response regulator